MGQHAWDPLLFVFFSVSKSYLTLFDPRNCSLPGSSVHGVFQARIPEWVAIPLLLGIFADQVFISCLLHGRVGSLPLTRHGIFLVGFAACRDVNVSCLYYLSLRHHSKVVLTALVHCYILSSPLCFVGCSVPFSCSVVSDSL